MATVSGTITGVSLLRAKGSRKTYLVSVNFGAYTGSADSADVKAVGAAITAHTRNGKTNTLRAGIAIGGGIDSNGQEIFLQGASSAALAVATDDLQGILSASGGTEVPTSTAATGVEIAVVVDES